MRRLIDQSGQLSAANVTRWFETGVIPQRLDKILTFACSGTEFAS